ncbi:hypothetical protein [Bordetella flabilis]|nr:hypothetical protein [Bordetella flabilis]
MTPRQFPILRDSLADPSRFDMAVEQVLAGVEAGSIRNVVWRDAKETLSRIVDKAWKLHVSEPFFYGKWESHPEDVRLLYNSIMVMGLHDIISTSKKVSRSKASGPAVDAMRTFCAEVLPLSEAVASLKNKVVKGRAPSLAPSKPVNPNKVVKTCPVCFRRIAVQRGTMAHHGYERPGSGWQTASCPGIQFKPLEVSSEGLEWLISTLHAQLATATRAYDSRGTHPEFLLVKRMYNGPLERVTRDDPLWPQAFRRHVAQLEGEIAGLKREIPFLEKKLEAWEPEAA